MSGLREAAEDYISVRRSLGFKLRDYPWLLGDFVTYLEAAGASTVTSQLAEAWALRPGEDAHPSYLSKRLSVVRGFARHLQAFDPATEVPPAELLPWQPSRAVPYLYTEADVVALMPTSTPRSSPASWTTSSSSATTASGPATPGSPPSARSSVTPPSATLNTPPSSPGSWTSPPNAANGRTSPT